MNLNERQLSEARNVARKVAHRPAEEVAQILNERLRLKPRDRLTADDARAILKG